MVRWLPHCSEVAPNLLLNSDISQSPLEGCLQGSRYDPAGWVLHQDTRPKEFECQPSFCSWRGQPGARLQPLRGTGTFAMCSECCLGSLPPCCLLPLAENHCRRPSPWKKAPIWVHTHRTFDFQVLLDWPSPVPDTPRELRTRLLTESAK